MARVRGSHCLFLAAPGQGREWRGGAGGLGADHRRLRARPELWDPTLMRKGRDLISPLERSLQTGGGGGRRGLHLPSVLCLKSKPNKTGVAGMAGGGDGPSLERSRRSQGVQ